MSDPVIQPILGLSDALGLIRDYDGEIFTLWNIYVAVIGAVVAVLTSERWKPHPVLLASAFAIFAGGNLYALQKFFRVKSDLLGYAQTLVPIPPGSPELDRLLHTLQPSSLFALYGIHVAFDVVVIAIIFIFAPKAANAGSRARKS